MEFLTHEQAMALSHPKETRAKLREMFPQARGAFAAQVDRNTVVCVLTGVTHIDNAMQAFVEAQAQSLANMPDEGKHGIGGQSPAADAQPANEEDEAINAAVRMMSVLNPKAAEIIARIGEKAKMVTAAPSAADGIVYSGNRVKIMNIDCPVICDDASPLTARVPAGDPEYRLGAWTASRKMGAARFEQGADDVLRMLLENERIMLVGPPGTGKTSLITQLASIMKWPVTRFNGNRDVCVDDFVGAMGAANGATVWQPGPLETAMTEGHIFILDEFDHMPSECSSIMHPVLEPGGKLTITNDRGRVVVPHPNFRVVLTSNTSGFGDQSGLHPAAAVQDYAMLTRCTAVFRVEYMSPKDEVKLLSKVYGADPEIAGKIVAVATDTRKAVAEQKLLCPIALRQTMAWTRFVAKGFDVGNAFILGVLNKMPETDANALVEIAQRHLGELLTKRKK